MIDSLIISIIVVFIGYLARFKEVKYGLEIAFIILTTFIAIRYNWGSDYPPYLEGFSTINEYSSFFEALNNERFEVGWLFINRFFAPIGFFGFTIVLTIFEYIILYKLIKRYVSKEWYWFALFIFTFSQAFMLVTSSMMRQFLAMSIFLIGVEYIIQRRWIISVAITLLASLFHTSALILLPFSFLGYLNFEISTKRALFLFGGYVVLYFTAAVIFGKFFDALIQLEQFNRYETYLGDEKATGGTGLGVIFSMIIILLLLLNYKKQDSKTQMLFMMFFVSTFFNMFASIAPLTGRLGYYFSILMIVVYPLLFKSMKRNLLYYGMIVGYMFITIRTFFQFFDPNGIWYNSFHKYQTIFSAPTWM